MLIDRHGHLNRYGQNEAATPEERAVVLLQRRAARPFNIDTSALVPAGRA